MDRGPPCHCYAEMWWENLQRLRKNGFFNDFNNIFKISSIFNVSHNQLELFSLFDKFFIHIRRQPPHYQLIGDFIFDLRFHYSYTNSFLCVVAVVPRKRILKIQFTNMIIVFYKDN